MISRGLNSEQILIYRYMLLRALRERLLINMTKECCCASRKYDADWFEQSVYSGWRDRIMARPLTELFN